MYLVISPGASPEAFFIDATTLKPFPHYRPGYESDSVERLLRRGRELSPDTLLYRAITSQLGPPYLQVPEGL